MLNPIPLQTLLGVLETGSLAGAAKRLGYSTSAVSQQIRSLERSVGTSLFERGPRRVWPTAAGVALGRHAAALVARIAEAEAELADHADGGRGRLRIGGFPSVGAHLLPRALSGLVDSCPQAELTVSDYHDPMRIATDVDERRLDLGLVFEYPHVPHDWPDDLVRHELLREELAVLCVRTGEWPGFARSSIAAADDRTADPPSDQEEAARAVSMSEFAGSTWLSTSQESAGHENLRRVCAAAGFEPTIRFHSSDYDVVRGFIRQGLGVALVPTLAIGTDRAIRMVRLSDPVPTRRVVLLWRFSDPNPLLRRAADALEAAAADFVEWTAWALPGCARRPMVSTPGQRGRDHQADRAAVRTPR